MLRQAPLSRTVFAIAWRLLDAELDRAAFTSPQPGPQNYPATWVDGEAGCPPSPLAAAQISRLPDKFGASSDRASWSERLEPWPHFVPRCICPANLRGPQSAI